MERAESRREVKELGRRRRSEKPELTVLEREIV